MAFGIVECSNLFRTLSSLGFYSRTVPTVTSYLTASLFLNILCFREGWSMAGSGRRLQKDTPIEGLHVHPWKLYNLKLSFQAQRWPQFLTVANLWVCSTSCLASRYFLQQYNNLSMLNSLYSKVLDFFPFSRLDFIQNQFYLLNIGFTWWKVTYLKARDLVPRILPSLYQVLNKDISNEGSVEAFTHSKEWFGLCS